MIRLSVVVAYRRDTLGTGESVRWVTEGINEVHASMYTSSFHFNRPLVRFLFLIPLFIRKDVDRAVRQRKILRLL
jgi:hypothetical protein